MRSAAAAFFTRTHARTHARAHSRIWALSMRGRIQQRHEAEAAEGLLREDGRGPVIIRRRDGQLLASGDGGTSRRSLRGLSGALSAVKDQQVRVAAWSGERVCVCPSMRGAPCFLQTLSSACFDSTRRPHGWESCRYGFPYNTPRAHCMEPYLLIFCGCVWQSLIQASLRALRLRLMTDDTAGMCVCAHCVALRCLALPCVAGGDGAQLWQWLPD
eukprot:COSAG05_NODE_5943_length_1053_cov_1.517820_1_plen_214_part_01